MNKDLVFGIHAVAEAINAGKEIDKILIKKGLKGELIQELFSLIKDRGISFQYVPQEKLDFLTKKNHQGVIAYLSLVEYTKLEFLIPLLFEKGKNPFVLILDEITDVRNFGAIVRTAECAGVDAVIIPAKGSAQINADAMKASAGAINHMAICKVANLKKTIHILKESGLHIFAATEKAQEFYTKQDYNQPLGIIMGAEDSGISVELLKIADTMIKIPMTGKIKSLNVSVATAVIIFEVIRQQSIN